MGNSILVEHLITVGALLAAVAGVVWGLLRRRDAAVVSERAPDVGLGALVFEHANDAIYLVRPDGTIVDANDRAAALYGLTREELRSRRLADLRAPEERSEEHISAQLAQVMAAGGGLFEILHRRQDGTRFPVEVSTRYCAGPDGPAFVSIVRDISDRRRAEADLLASEQRYRNLVENILDMVVEYDDSCRVLYVSPQYESLVGYDAAEAVGCHVCEHVHEDDCDLVVSELGKTWSRGFGHVVFRQRHKSGEWRWIESFARTYSTPEGRRQGVMLARDITQSKLSEEAWRLSEARYRQIFEGSRAVQLLIDPATATIVDANPAACEFYRYPAERIKGLSLEVLDTHSRPALPEELAKLASQPAATFQAEHCLASGERREVEVHVSPVEVSGKCLLYAIVHDVTQRLRAEAERDRVIQLLKTTASVASHFLTTPDPRQAALRVVETLGQAVSVDRCYWFEGFTDEGGRLLARIMGEWCRPGIPAVSGHPALQAVPTANFPRFLRALQNGEVIAGAVADFPPEEQAMLALGGTKAAVLVPFVIRGTATGFLGFDLCTHPRVWRTDEIHLMHAAANTFAMALESWEQRQQREELANVVEQASEAVVITDRRWRIRYVNPAYTRITGYGRDESLGLRPGALMLKAAPSPPPPDAKEGPERGESWSGIVESWRKDHVLLQTQSTVFPLRDSSGEILGFASIHVDVTSQLRLEDQLRRAQKMEALGQFASGIAHDFNNLITVILGTAELLLRRIDGDAAFREELTTIRRTAQRSSALTNALLAFARRQLLRREDLDLNVAIGETLPMLRRVLPESITLRYSPTSSTSGISADRGQIEQVLLNLVANARDAMSGGGTLTLATENLQLGPDYVTIHPWAREGSYVELSVTDTGTGMDDATLVRVFEPFFTTKEPGKGTGLGLSSVFGIVKQHGGMIDVYSVAGVGSTFKVYLPLLDREVDPGISRPEAPEVRGGHERVLVVEDQGDLRKVLTSILQDLGYQVRVARDGMEALAVLEETGGAFEIVISDMVMPRLDGLELLRRCRQGYPHVAFLLQSGYSEAGSVDMIPNSPRIGFVSKPYSIELLAHHVRSLIDAPPAPN